MDDGPPGDGRQKGAGQRYGAPAAACAADVLQAMARSATPLSVATMSRSLGYTRSMLYRVLTELEERELVSRADASTFQLSLGVLELGGAVAARQSISEDCQDALRDLARETNQSTNIGVLRGADVLFVMKQDAPHAVVSVSYVGRRLPANCLAVGKMLLSRLSDEQVQAAFEGVYPRQTSRSTDAWPALREELDRTRERGYAVDYEGSAIGRCSVAIPLTLPGHEQEPAGIDVTSSVDSFDERLEEHLAALYRARDRLERGASSRLAMDTGQVGGLGPHY